MKAGVACPSYIHRRMLANTLERIGCEEVRQFRCGETLIDELMEHGLDLVVATRDLPRMSEYDLVRGVRAYSCQTDKSILVVMAGTDFNQNEVLEAIKARVHQIVVLPVDKRDLEMKVEAARSMAG